MSHTKGELEVFANSFGQRILVRAKGKGFNVAYCGDDYDGFSLQEQEANAERLALCWNSHDKLLEACKVLYKIIVANDVLPKSVSYMKEAKAVITEAEKE